MERMRMAAIALILALGIAAEARDTNRTSRWTKAIDYENRADWRLHFEDWNKLWVFTPPTTNEGVVATHMIGRTNLMDAVASAPEKRDLAVVIISHRFYSHYNGDAGETQIDALTMKLRQAGFKRIVVLGETSMGNKVMRD